MARETILRDISDDFSLVTAREIVLRDISVGFFTRNGTGDVKINEYHNSSWGNLNNTSLM